MNQSEEWRDKSGFIRQNSFNQNSYPNQGSYLGLRQPYPESEHFSDHPRNYSLEEDNLHYQGNRMTQQRFNPDGQQAEVQHNLRSQPQSFSPKSLEVFNRYIHPQDYQAMDGGPNTHEDFSRPMHPQVHEEFSRPMHPQEHEKFGRQMHPQAHEEFSRPMHPQDDERLREAYNPQNPLPEGFDRSSRSQDQFARHQPLFQVFSKYFIYNHQIDQ